MSPEKDQKFNLSVEDHQSSLALSHQSSSTLNHKFSTPNHQSTTLEHHYSNAQSLQRGRLGGKHLIEGTLERSSTTLERSSTSGKPFQKGLDSNRDSAYLQVNEDSFIDIFIGFEATVWITLI